MARRLHVFMYNFQGGRFLIEGHAVEAGGLKDGPVFDMVRNERTAGFIPSWDSQKSSSQAPLSFGEVLEGERLELAETNNAVLQNPEPFGFFDLLDMINPLHHIPLIGTIYRAITGDEIRGISRIVGGGIFGGPLGAAGGLVTEVIEDGTGKEPAELALSFISGQGRESHGASAKASEMAARYEQVKQAGQRIRPTIEYNA